MNAVLYRARLLFRRRGRAWIGMAVVLGVFAGITMALAEGAQRTNAAYPRFVQAKRAADVVVAGANSFGLVGSVDPAKVVALPGVVAHAPAFVALPFSATVGNRPDELGVADLLPVASSDDRLGTEVEAWKMLDGRAADPRRPDEATASFELARRLHVRVGDSIRFHFYDAATFPQVAISLLAEKWPARLEALRRDERAPVTDPADGPVVTVRVVGIEASPLEFPPLINDLAPVLHLTPAFEAAYASRIFGSPISYVRLSHPDDLREFQLAVERLANGKPVSFISTLQNQQPKVQRSIRAESLGLGILAVLVAFAGAVALAQALTRQAFAESADDDLLRALGMERRQLFAVAIVRSGVIAVVAAAVACLLGWLVAPAILLSLARRANLDHGFPVDETALAIGAAAVIMFTIGVGAIAALLAARAPRTAASPGAGGTKRAGIGDPLRRSWLPLPALLGVRFAIQRARRSPPAWSAIAGVGLCIAMLTFASTFTAHLHRALAEKERYGWNWDLKIGAPALPDIGSALVPVLREQPGLTDLSVGAVTQLEVGTTRVDVLALDSIVGRAEPTILEGRAPRAPDEIALGTRTMRAVSSGIGRTIEARIGSVQGRYHVVGRAVFPEFGDSGQLGTGVWMTVPGVRRLLPTAPRDTFLVGIRPAPGTTTREAQLSAALNPMPSQDDARPADLVNLARGDGLLLALGILLGVLALAMLVHTLVTAVRGARRNHAALRALGYTRAQSRATVLWQSGTLAAGALLIGLPLGLVTGRWIWAAFANRLGVAADPFVPAATIVLATGAAIVVAILAAAPPGWLVTHTDVPATLRAPD